MKFPAKVRIAPHEYAIALDQDSRLEELEDLNGLCDFDRSRIWIRDRLTPRAEQDTVLHEVLHAVFDQLDVKRRMKDVDSSFEEDVVYALAPRLLAVMRDNPKLLQYLLD